MSKFLLINVSLSLALGALLVMFTPFLREFSALHVGAELLGVGAFICGTLCFINLAPARRAIYSLAIMLIVGSLIEATVIALPALMNLVPNPVSYINLAEQQVLIGCIIAGPLTLAGGVFGGVMRATLLKSRMDSP